MVDRGQIPNDRNRISLSVAHQVEAVQPWPKVSFGRSACHVIMLT